MIEKKKAENRPRGYVHLLDEIIEICYKHILNEDNNKLKDVKVGELFKMFELRHKIDHDIPLQKKLWDKLEKIRKKHQLKSNQKRKTGKKNIQNSRINNE